MTALRRLAIATDGFRGGGEGLGENIYINQELELIQNTNPISVDIPLSQLNVSIEKLSTEISIDYVGTEVISVEIDGAY